MEYMTIEHLTNSASSGHLSVELDEIMNAQASLEWRLREIVQVRANLFLLVFEK